VQQLKGIGVNIGDFSNSIQAKLMDMMKSDEILLDCFSKKQSLSRTHFGIVSIIKGVKSALQKTIPISYSRNLIFVTSCKRLILIFQPKFSDFTMLCPEEVKLFDLDSPESVTYKVVKKEIYFVVGNGSAVLDEIHNFNETRFKQAMARIGILEYKG